MNGMAEDVSEEAARDYEFTSVYDELLEILFLKKKPGLQSSLKSIEPGRIQKATWLASIVALGTSERLKNLANSFGALLYLYAPNNPVYQKACYVLQSRSGNLVSSRHVPNIFQNGKYKDSFGTMLDVELGARRGRFTHTFRDTEKFVFTEYQNRLWREISAGRNVAISAPTSAGKSFIIRRHIVESLLNSVGIALYIVPTKALINQISTDFKSDFKNEAHVYTTYRPSNDLSKSKVFVLTPERCMKLMQDKSFPVPTIAFFDEIHNLEDQSRGLIFENILHRLVRHCPSAQFIFAGPYIDDIVTPISKVSGLILVDETTIASPVFQLKAAITFKPKSKIANYRIFSQTGKIIEGEMPLKKALYSKTKNNQGEAIASFLDNLSKKESCIIFAPRKYSAERWALKIAPIIGMSNPEIVEGADQRVIDLIGFLEDEIHPEYCLIRALRMGVAFHHAGLPDIARIEVEELYSDNVIRHLVCTSTLLQGVNLPADKLIVINPANDKTPLTSFEFMNLIGRAGRVSTNLYGEVYCLDVQDEQWGQDRLSDNKKKSIRPRTISSLEDKTAELIRYATKKKCEILETEDGRKLYPSVSYLRHLYAADKAHFERLLATASLTSAESIRLSSALERSVSKLHVPTHLLQQNPYVDPLLQDELYLKIKNDSISAWIPNKYPLQRQTEDFSEPETSPAFEELNFYRQFESIALRLNEIFDIEDEINHGKFNDYISIGRLVFDAYQWMSGKSHRFFIDDYLEYKNKHEQENSETLSNEEESKIDRAARFVTGHISRDITFILVKYFSLWSDVVSSFLSEKEQERFAYALSLPSMIELGSYDPKVLELMSLGINRSIALRLKKYMKGDIEDTEKWLYGFNIHQLPSLLARYLSRSGLTKEKYN